MDFESFVLAAPTADLDEEPAAREHADAVEFRMDLAEEPAAALDAYDGELPLIATNRSPAEGGEATGDEAARLEALLSAAAHPAVEAIDVELDVVDGGLAEEVVERLGELLDGANGPPVDDLVATARSRDADVIVSAHDFEGMPGRDGLGRTLTRAAELGDVAKFAGVAESLDDALDLLAVTRERSAAGDAVATMAMGEAGRHTRAVAPIYGSRIGYAPVDPASATAPGQYDLETLRSLVTALDARTED